MEYQKNALSIIYKHHGVVFGGYVRDQIAGVIPTDIDAVTPKDTYNQVCAELVEAGYIDEGLQDNGSKLFTKANFLSVELMKCDDLSTDEVFIGPEAVPDFDVNTLAYDGVKMYNWVDPSGRDIFSIIRNIRDRKARNLEAAPDRITKMEEKGYKIV